jgi:hypothetical protein
MKETALNEPLLRRLLREGRPELAREQAALLAVEDPLLIWESKAEVLRISEGFEDLLVRLGLEDGHCDVRCRTDALRDKLRVHLSVEVNLAGTG